MNHIIYISLFVTKPPGTTTPPLSNDDHTKFAFVRITPCNCFCIDTASG